MAITEIANLKEEELTARAAQLAEDAETEGADLDAIEAETALIEERMKQIKEERRAAMAEVAAGAGVPIARKEEKKPMATLNEIRASVEYENAYAEYLKTGREMECRAVLSELGIPGENNAALPVPVYVEDRIETAWQRSRIYQRIRKISTKGIVRVPREVSGDDAQIHEEGGPAVTEENLVLGSTQISPTMIKKWISVSDEVVALKGRAFLDYIMDEIEYKIVQKFEDSVIDMILSAAILGAGAGGNSTELPRVGMVGGETGVTVKAGTIFEMLATLADGAENPVAIMSKKTFYTDFMSLTDLQGRPIYNIVSENGRPAYYINGVEVIFSSRADKMSAIGSDATFRGVIVGDLDGILANFPDGDQVKFVNDPYTLATSDMLRVIGKLYAGVGIVRDDYFAVALLDRGTAEG